MLGVPVATSVVEVNYLNVWATFTRVSVVFAFRSTLIDKGKVEVFKKTGSEIGKAAATKSGGLFSADDCYVSLVWESYLEPTVMYVYCSLQWVFQCNVYVAHAFPSYFTATVKPSRV